MVKHTQTIRRQFADKLFECLTILKNWCLKGYHSPLIQTFLHKHFILK